MKKYFFITLLLISSKYFVAQAQDFSDYNPNNVISYDDFINNSFSELDTTQFPTDVFYNRTLGMSDLFYLQGKQNDSITNYEKTLSSYRDISLASKNKYNNRNISEIDSGFSTDNKNGIINFFIQMFDYHFIKKSALDSSMLTFNNDKFYDIPNRISSPYVKQLYFSSVPTIDKIFDLQNTFILKQCNFITNKVDNILRIEIDFGLGYQQIWFDTPIGITFSTYGDKIIKTKIRYTNDSVFYTQAVLKVESPINILKSINGIGLPDATIEYPSVSQTDAHAGIWYGCGNTSSKIRKPAIIVMGFDPMSIVQTEMPIQTAITSGVMYDKFNKDMFLDKLREEGYDIIIIGFVDGMGDILNNANILKNFIGYLNIEKNNNLNTNYPNVLGRGSYHENIIVGYSSGALYTKIALRRMEAAGINHQCRTYVSYDGEHQGANIALGVQFYIDDDLALNTSIATLQFLNATQTKQMLKYYYAAHSGTNANQHNLRSALVNELNTLGYPTKTRNIGVSNASYKGTLQSNFNEGDRLFAKKRETDANPVTWVPAYKDNIEYFALSNNSNSPVYNKISAFKWPFSNIWHYSNSSKQIKVSNALSIDNAVGSTLPIHNTVSGFTDFFTTITFLERKEVLECFSPLVSGLDIKVPVSNLAYDIRNHNLHYITPSITSPNYGFYGYPYLKNANPKNITPFDMVVANNLNQEHALNPQDNIGSILANDIAPNVLSLTNRNIIDNADFEAREKIIIGNTIPNYYATEAGNFIINAGVNSVIKAGEEITFLPGFEVKASAEFHAYIDNAQYNGCADALYRLAYNDLSEENLQFVDTREFPIVYKKSLENNDNTSIELYPNPASNSVFIKADFCNTKNAVIVLNSLGVFIKQYNAEDLCKSLNEINLTDFANGTYFVQIINNGKVTIKKIAVIKQ